MARIARASRLPIAAMGAVLVLAGPIATARAQVNNGPGIGPSSELERPDLARQEAKPADGSASQARPAHAKRPLTKAAKTTAPPHPN